MSAIGARLNGTSWLEARHPGCGSCSRLAGGLRRFLNASRLLALASLLIAGCATVPRDIPRPPSVAFQDHESTALGQRIAKAHSSGRRDACFGTIPRRSTIRACAL